MFGRFQILSGCALKLAAGGGSRSACYSLLPHWRGLVGTQRSCSASARESLGTCSLAPLSGPGTTSFNSVGTPRRRLAVALLSQYNIHRAYMRAGCRKAIEGQTMNAELLKKTCLGSSAATSQLSGCRCHSDTAVSKLRMSAHAFDQFQRRCPACPKRLSLNNQGTNCVSVIETPGGRGAPPRVGLHTRVCRI